MSMFSKMLGNSKESKKDSKNEILLEKISKMNLSDMRFYINSKLKEFEVSEFGLLEIAKKLTLVNENTLNLYLKDDDMDSKKKKVFELVILLLSNSKVSISIIETIQNFLETYSEIVKKYDEDNKQIYEQKIKESISMAVDKIDFKAEEAGKLRTLN